jgi:hypothetical protein
VDADPSSPPALFAAFGILRWRMREALAPAISLD